MYHIDTPFSMTIYLIVEKQKEIAMKKILIIAVAAVIGIAAFNAQAKNKYYMDTADCQKIDKEARTALMSCLQDEKNTTKGCMKHTKEMMKMQKKSLKEAYKKEQMKLHDDK
jgi:hypothetical protein